MRMLLEHIRHKGLISRGDVNGVTIDRLSKSQLLQLAESLASLTPPERQCTRDTPCMHLASIGLGGGRDDCCYVECRKKRLDSLARFAALYSDRVFIRNFFSDYEHRQDRSVDDLKMTLADDVSLILHISSLLEQGLLAFVSEVGVCPNCPGEALGFGPHCGREFKRAQNDLAGQFLERLVATAVQEQGMTWVEVSSPSPYSECNRLIDLDPVPRVLLAKPKLMRQLSQGSRIQLSKTMAKAMGIHSELADGVVHSVVYHAIMNHYLCASLLTDKELELSFLNRASGDTLLERRNSIAMRHLTALVPFVDDVPVKKLYTLRNREAGSLLRFRRAFNRVLSEFGERDSGLSAKTAKQLYGDVLAPELARLNDKVRRAKEDLVSATMRPFVGMVGAISFGLLSGLIPAEIAHVAQAIGITSFGAAFLEKLMALGDAERAIRQDDFYFLWKVKKLARARKT